MAAMRSLILFAGLACLAGADSSVSQVLANPVRKVVNLLQKMQKQVVAEGEKEEELYQKFVCYCKTGTGDLTASIDAAEAKIPQLAKDIEASEAKKKEVEEALAQAKKDRTDAKEAMAAATAKREEEAAAYAKFQADSVANIQAIVKAVAALSKGAAGGFLQTPAASVVKKIFSISDTKHDVNDYDRQEVLSFLAGNPFSQGYAAGSGQIIGILKEMGDEMAAGLADATHLEEKAIHIFKALMGAKAAEVAALSKMIEAKIQKTGELAVAIAEMSNDHEDTVEALAADKKFLAELEKSCGTKAREWEERSKTRTAELAALADTIKILNNDDALELFKKTLPAPSLLEVSDKAVAARARARNILLQIARKAQQPQAAMLGFVELALRGNKIGLDKVIAMIDEMVATLKKEQKDDDSKQEYCTAELDTSDDKKKSLEKTISDTEASIAATKEDIESVTEEIAALKAGIKALDKMVAEATDQRKAENADYKELMASDTAAKQLLGMALNRLNQFYNPKMYKPPAKVERTKMNAIYQDVQFVQISSHHQVAPPPAPETWDAYAKKGDEHGGVVAMINLLITDLDKEMAEAETTENDSQADYESLMRDSAEKRADDAKAIADKEGAKASMEGDLQSHQDDLKEAKRDLGDTLKYIHSLHLECDWLLKYFDVRKEMRASEIDALGKAKAVLSGADYSLL